MDEPMLRGHDVAAQALEDRVLKAWHAEVCLHADRIDLDRHLDWRSLWIGFALARGLAVTRAARIYKRKAQPLEPPVPA